jgi:hypothetical protein
MLLSCMKTFISAHATRKRLRIVSLIKIIPTKILSNAYLYALINMSMLVFVTIQ